MKTRRKRPNTMLLFHEFLVLKGKMRQMDELTPQELNKFLSEFLISAILSHKDSKEVY